MAPGAQAQPFCVPQDEATSDVQHPEKVLYLSSLRRCPLSLEARGLGHAIYRASIAEAHAVTGGPIVEIVGMVGVQQHEDNVGEIRRLRVRHDYRRRGIGSALVEVALKFCRDRGYLKIALDTFMEREPAIRLFEKFHFRHSRTRSVMGKEVMHFYLDLYQREGGGGHDHAAM